MARVGLDGRDLLRKRTGVVNNTVHLARELTCRHASEVIVYVDQPATSLEAEASPEDVPLRRLNAPRLLRAVARLGYGLLFVGRDIWGSDPTARLASDRGWGWARFAGYVPDAELPALYAAARVFAYPSLYEGFGIPPLEAMACGTPVVASTAGALPEVLGDAALLVDPYDENALAQAIQAAAEDRGALRQRGLERAARFTWQRAAAETWQVYTDVAMAR